MSMTRAYRDAIAAHGASLIKFIGLVDGDGNELRGGTPAYARAPVKWTPAEDGVVRPDADVLFEVPAGATVAGWRGYSSLMGGTEYGGADLTAETYAEQGQYEIVAAKTAIQHPSA